MRLKENRSIGEPHVKPLRSVVGGVDRSEVGVYGPKLEADEANEELRSMASDLVCGVERPEIGVYAPKFEDDEDEKLWVREGE